MPRFFFRCRQYVSFVRLNAENTSVFVRLDAENTSVLYVLVLVKTYVNVCFIEHFT